jgi:hypothetical protein
VYDQTSYDCSALSQTERTLDGGWRGWRGWLDYILYYCTIHPLLILCHAVWSNNIQVYFGILDTITGSAASKALQSWGPVWIHVILAPLRRFVDIRDEVFHNREIAELGTPSAPVANTNQAPTTTSIQPLTPTTSKWMRAVWRRVNSNIQQIVPEHFQEELAGLLKRYELQNIFSAQNHTICEFWAETRSPEAIFRNK